MAFGTIKGIEKSFYDRMVLSVTLIPISIERINNFFRCFCELEIWNYSKNSVSCIIKYFFKLHSLHIIEFYIGVKVRSNFRTKLFNYLRIRRCKILLLSLLPIRVRRYWFTIRCHGDSSHRSWQ